MEAVAHMDMDLHMDMDMDMDMPTMYNNNMSMPMSMSMSMSMYNELVGTCPCPCPCSCLARSGLRWAKGAHVSRRTIDGARMSSLRRVQKVLVGLVCPVGRDERAAPSRKKGVCA